MATSLRALSVLILSAALTVTGLGAPAQAQAGAPVPDLGLLREGRKPASLTGGSALHPKSAAGAEFSDGQYVVRLREPPVTSYGGEVKAATKPAAGQDLEPHSPAAENYRRHLGEAQRDVLADAGATARQTYTTAFNGFTAKLTGAKAAELAEDPRVAAVTKAQIVKADSATLGQAGRAPQPAGSAEPQPGKGSGVVVGVIDTGIWPESASFAATVPAPEDWHGTCQVGDGFPATACNGKILGARYFADGWLAMAGALPDGELLSARDMQGHGTHTASTAAGLPIKHATVLGRDLGKISGVAPDAQIAVYKALWGGSGTDADIIAAIDAAVADGVDVINYSIGSQMGDYQANSPIGNAFLNAYLAGVFVAASAGNDGMSGMISNAEPWVTTVGAAVERAHEATVRLGDGTKIIGTSMDVLPQRDRTPIVFADRAGSVEAGAQFCYGGSLDAAKVTGKIVACDLEDMNGAVQEVKAKGGVGVVLFQTYDNVRLNVIQDFPAVYLWSAEQAGQIFNYLWAHRDDGTAALVTGGDGSSLPGLPSVAGLSAYGPDQVHTGLQKPDLVADGVDVVAAVSPMAGGRLFDAYSGTSMASPHVAGMAAVLRAQHPEWSPGAVAPALRTSPADTKGTDSPLRQGSGRPAVARATDPGLVVEPSADSLTAFAEAATPDGKELNLPSIALREYDGLHPVTMTRRFTNVSTRTETYRARVEGLSGMDVTVKPQTFTVRPGASATVTIKVARGHLEPGFTGPLAGRTTGYTPVPWTGKQLTTTVSGGAFAPGGIGTQGTRIVVPRGTAGLIVQTASEDPDINLDLYLYKDGKLVERSWASWHSSERVARFFPEPGVYTAYAHAQTTNSTTVPYQLGVTVVPAAGAQGNATITTPPRVERGGSAQVKLTPVGPQPDVEQWAYTEFRTGRTVVPGLLISSR